MRSMAIESPIAVRQLKAKWKDGSTHYVTIELGKPFAVGNSFRCPLQISGLQPDYSPPDVSGYDAVQALTLTLTFVRFLLEEHVVLGGQLFYDDGSPYVPNDLPKEEDGPPS
jgi:hypothetical protein